MLSRLFRMKTIVKSVVLYIKRLVSYISTGQPVVYANISQLSPNELLSGKTALITGGTSGIGLEIAKAYINAGAFVIITGRNIEKVLNTCSLINKSVIHKNNIIGIEMNNRDIQSFNTKFHEILSKIGGKKIDILVNNAGVVGGHISNTTEYEFDSILDTNLKAVFFLSKIVGDYYINNGIKGNILNIASSSSLRPAISAYTISKWGVRGLTLGLAKSLSPFGITVNGLAPGQTATPILGKKKSGIDEDISSTTVPIGRYAIPQEIANMAVILVSPIGKMIMGDTIYMTGGAGIFSNQDMDYHFKK